MLGLPSASEAPWWRDWVTISASENGSSASASTQGPSSTTVTWRPASANLAAESAPPAPAPPTEGPPRGGVGAEQDRLSGHAEPQVRGLVAQRAVDERLDRRSDGRIGGCDERPHDLTLEPQHSATAYVVADHGCRVAPGDAPRRRPARRPYRSGQRRRWRRRLPLGSPSAQARRHAGAEGPVSAGDAPAWARRRADHQSVVASSARASTARWMAADRRRALSAGPAARGVPNVTVAVAGVGQRLPLRRMRPVPCRWIGTTGTPERSAR